jgi:Ca2+-binding RTX toxin-like protein
VWRIKANGIPDSEHPLWIYDDTVDETGTTGNVTDTGVTVDFWHSATFSWDGSIVKFEDESFGEGCPTETPVAGETATQPGDTGRLFFFDTYSGKKLSQFMPDASWEAEYCSAHLGNFVATDDGKKLLVYAWYLGGVTVIDVTDPTKPTRVGYYDGAGGIPPDASGPNGFDNWAAYWYEGPSLPGDSLTIYATDGVHEPTTDDGGARGFMSLRTDIAASEVNLDSLNPQTQRQLIPPVKCKGKVATVVGGPLSDVLEGTPGDDVISTLAGNDTVKGGKGDDTICLGGGKDTGKGGGGDDLIVGEAGKDTCIGGPGADKARKCEEVKSV